ncbi:MAG: hypothetical protein ACLU62_05810, partial [Hydrogeniiclostridium sp.]
KRSRDQEIKRSRDQEIKRSRDEPCLGRRSKVFGPKKPIGFLEKGKGFCRIWFAEVEKTGKREWAEEYLMLNEND